MKNLRQDLEERGFLHQFTDEKVFDLFEKWWQKFYFWVDCSADSMTIGNFVALMMAIHFMRRGNKCYLLVGGATSTIWNPSGKDDERPILTEQDLAKNQAGIAAQFKRLTDNISSLTWDKLEYEVVNNYDFHKDLNVLDYLKEVGRYVTVNWMIGKDIVKKRITDPDKFISYAEFSYMLIMGYDYYYLWKHMGVTLEVGWSDEWDGILAGLELVSKKDGWQVYGVTNKLIMDANGKKFGKSEWNAVWLDENKTSPYAMYQYFMNTLDADVERYLKLFTFDTDENIKTIVDKHNSAPEKRYGQYALAQKVVNMIHGEDQSILVQLISDILFSKDIDAKKDKILSIWTLSDENFDKFCKEMGSIEYTDQNLFGLFIESWLEKSGGTTRQSLSSGALYINEQKLTDNHYDFSGDFIDNKFLLIRKGKKNFRIVKK